MVGQSVLAPGETAEPVYRIHVFCCTNQRPDTHRRGSCVGRGAKQLCDYMCRLGMTLGVSRIRINHAGCLNVCELGPVLVIYPEGTWYHYETESDIEAIMRSHVVRGIPVERLRLHIDPTTIHG